MSNSTAPRNRRVPWKSPPAPVVRRNVRIRLERLSEAEEPVRWWHWLIGAIVVVVLIVLIDWN